VLHDEMESSTGTIKLRRGESSPRGHNGIKSIQQSLRSTGQLADLGDRFIKIGIGISRPASRDSHDVSAWVLGQLTHVERSKIEAATDSLIAVLESEIGRLGRS
jgi:PTH1 family peptidyl-tRNA hydrolase